MLPNCTTLSIMNKTMKSKKMHDQKYTTITLKQQNVRPSSHTNKQAMLDKHRSSYEVISQTIDKILNKIKD